MIAQALKAAITERWPFLEISGKFLSEFSADLYAQHNIKVVKNVTDTIYVNWPLNVINEMPSHQEAKIWIASIFITWDMIQLSIIKDKFSYENTLIDPASLDEFYTILGAHIADVAGIIPESYRILQYPNEPTLLELDAYKTRKAHMLSKSD